MDHAFTLLGFDGVITDDLQPSIRRVADVLWLLKRNADMDAITPSDGSLLAEALRDLAEEG
ncbi:hypothetical protein [Variovorax sp. DT-64]|uniref:hypothetical protein n=1 Tax=Variovorax sp. DT-64 TaxID=3396160 RepID=UPI003F1A4D71